VERRLAAILAADVVGYSRLMEADEAGTLATLKARRKQVLEPLLARHHGRLVKVMRDGALVEFASAVSAVECALALQRAMAEANRGATADRAVLLRIGISLGDVVVEGSDLYGEGVIVATWLEAMAEPGGICVSGSVHQQVGRRIPVGCGPAADGEVRVADHEQLGLTVAFQDEAALRHFFEGYREAGLPE
jgi:class 3 adenylate cyclase